MVEIHLVTGIHSRCFFLLHAVPLKGTACVARSLHVSGHYKSLITLVFQNKRLLLHGFSLIAISDTNLNCDLTDNFQPLLS